MSNELNVYACRSCENTQFAKEKPMSCEQCGGSLSIVHGVHIIQKDSEGGGVRKYAHELSR
jgi:Zn finger protein HypA/HybF involved in hydrogenase expression